MILPWHEQRRQQMRSTRWPSPAGRQIPTSPVGSVRERLVRMLGLAQPGVQAPARAPRGGAVDVREEGRQRLYRLNGHALKPIRDWVKDYERSWSERSLDVVGGTQGKEAGDGSSE